jgi:hypothetical protein
MQVAIYPEPISLAGLWVSLYFTKKASATVLLMREL